MKTIEEKAKAYADRVADGTSEVWHFMDEVYTELKDAYLAGATEALAGQWRRVDDELPKAEQDVLVAMGYGEFDVAWLTSLSNGTCKWYSNDETLSLDNIKFWMHIPEPPKDKSE